MMSTQPREVQNFRFKEIRKLRAFEGELSRQEPKNLLTISNRFGLIFVGHPSGFKVLNISETLDFNDSKDVIRVEIKDYPHQNINLSLCPSHLALSCDDLSLIVCIIKDSCQHALVYDVRAFADTSKDPEPFIEIILSSTPSVTVTDVTWNPKVSNMLATCLNDGSVAIYELNDTALKICATLPSTTCARAICWSPKGKQLIVGKNDGSLVQYKPNLQEVRSIPPPNICENSLSVLNLIWLSSFSFAVTYVDANNSDERPNLMIVNAPKSGAPIFTSYDDICYSSGDLHQPFYSMIHQPEWGLLLCTSSNSMEVGVMGLAEDKNSWEQWILEDSGRAELPLDGKNEMYPVGLSLSYTCIKEVMIDNHVLPPTLVLLMLSTKGVLCPFHMINTKADAGNIIKQAEVLTSEGQRRRMSQGVNQGSIVMGTPLTSISKDAQEVSFTKQIDSKPQITMNNPSVITSSHIITNTGGNKISTIPPKDISTPLFSVVSPTFTSTPKNTSLNQLHFQEVQSTFTVPSTTIPQNSKLNQPNRIGSSAFQPTPAAINKNANLTVVGDSHLKNMSEASLSGKPRRLQEKSYSTSNIFTNAILEEMNNFNKELQALKLKTSQSSYLVGTPEELLSLKQSLDGFQKFSNDIKDLSKELDQEINTLRLKMLEAFTTIEENKTLQQRNSDSHYRNLLKSRCLDSRSSKKMKAIWQLYHYVQCQIREVHYQLDEEWETLGTNRKKYSQRYLPYTEAIYQSLLNTQNVIAALPYKLDELQESVNLMKFNGFLPTKLKSANSLIFKRNKNDLKQDINSLTENLQKTTIHSTPPHWKQRKILSPAKEAQLRNFLGNRLVTPVRSSAPGNLSRLVMPDYSEDITSGPDHSYNVQKNGLHSSTFVIPLKSVTSTTNTIPQSPPAITSTPYPATFRPVAMPFTINNSQLSSQMTGVGGEGDTVLIQTPAASQSKSHTMSTPSSDKTGGKPISTTPLSTKTVGSITGNSENVSRSLFMTNQSKSSPETKLSSSADIIKKTVPVTASSTLFSFTASTSSFTSNPSVFTFGNKLACNNKSDFVLAANTKTTPITNVTFGSATSAPLFTLGTNKSLSMFQFKPVENKDTPSEAKSSALSTFNFSLKPVEKISSSNESSAGGFTFGSSNFAGVFQFGTPNKSPNLNDSDKTKKPTEETTFKREESKTSHLILEDVTPPSTPVDGSAHDDGEENDAPDDNEGGIIIEEITEEQEKLLISGNNDVITGNLNPIHIKETSTLKFSPPVISETQTVFVPNMSTLTESAHQMQERKEASPPAKESASTSPEKFQERTSVETSPSLSSSTVKVVTPNQITAVDSNNLADMSKTIFVQPTDPSGINRTTTAASAAKPQEVQVISTASPVVKTPLISTQSVASVPSDLPTAVNVESESRGHQSVDYASTQSGQAIPDTLEAKPAVTVETTSAPLFTLANIATSTTTLIPTSSTSTVSVTSSVVTSSTMSPLSFEKKPGQPSLFGNRSNTPSSFSFAQSSPGFGSFSLTMTTSSLFPSTTTSTTTSPRLFSDVTTSSMPPPYGQQQQQPVFGQSTFGSPTAFGQNTSSAFGQSKSAFGQTGSSVFGQTSNSGWGFGNIPTTESSFSSGTGGFFSGLGGKPNPENANKNVFGGASTFGSPSSTNNLFGNQSTTSFGSKFGANSPGGSFTSSGNSVAQSGFGGFQFQVSSIPKIGSGFGGGMGFGSSFGSPQQQAFGSSPTFGSTQPTLGNFPQSSNFAGFANTDSPTFGSLAAQSPPAFGNVGQTQSNISFGSTSPPPPTGFGNSSFGGGNSSAFGGSGFGTPPSPSGSSFQQWRS